MSRRQSDLLFFGGGECVEQYGTIIRRISPDDTGYVAIRQTTQSYTINGTSYWAADDVPTVTYLSGEAYLKCRNNDKIRGDFHHAPQEMTVYCKFIERQIPPFNNHRIWCVTSTGDLNPRLILLKGPGTDQYRFRHITDAGSSTAEQDINPVSGSVIEARGVLHSNGSVTLGLTIDGGTESVVSGSTHPLQSAWAGPYCWINSAGALAGAAGQADYRTVKVVRGSRTLEEMRAY